MQVLSGAVFHQQLLGTMWSWSDPETLKRILAAD
jgi:hypothetical protein